MKAYLAGLPADRRSELEAILKLMRENMPAGFQEGMQYGMIGWSVPHSIYPPGYHCDPKQPLPFAGLAAQKNHLSLYLMSTYGDGAHWEWFRKAWQKTGKKLDMGRCCVRFKRADDVAHEVVAEALRRTPLKDYLRRYGELLMAAGAKHAAAAAVALELAGGGGARAAASPRSATRPSRSQAPRKKAASRATRGAAPKKASRTRGTRSR